MDTNEWCDNYLNLVVILLISVIKLVPEINGCFVMNV